MLRSSWNFLDGKLISRRTFRISFGGDRLCSSGWRMDQSWPSFLSSDLRITNLESWLPHGSSPFLFHSTRDSVRNKRQFAEWDSVDNSRNAIVKPLSDARSLFTPSVAFLTKRNRCMVTALRDVSIRKSDLPIPWNWQSEKWFSVRLTFLTGVSQILNRIPFCELAFVSNNFRNFSNKFRNNKEESRVE